MWLVNCLLTVKKLFSQSYLRNLKCQSQIMQPNENFLKDALSLRAKLSLPLIQARQTYQICTKTYQIRQLDLSWWEKNLTGGPTATINPGSFCGIIRWGLLELRSCCRGTALSKRSSNTTFIRSSIRSFWRKTSLGLPRFPSADLWRYRYCLRQAGLHRVSLWVGVTLQTLSWWSVYG